MVEYKTMSKQITVEYYAYLREQRGESTEVVATDFLTIKELYEDLKEQYHFSYSADELKVAINDEFQSWDALLSDRDKVVFIPPVAGG